MKTLRPALIATAVAVLLVSGAGAPRAQAADSKPTVLIDFADLHRDSPDSPYNHPYGYAFQSWDHHVFDLPRKGALAKAPSGKGGLGEERTMVEFKGWSSIAIHFVIGSGNKAKALNFSLEDSDGTEHTWRIPLEGAVGREIRHHLDVAKPDSEAKPGKKPGLNLKKIDTWQIKGDYTDDPVEVLLIRVTGSE